MDWLSGGHNQSIMSGFFMIISFLNQKSLGRLHLAVLLILSAAHFCFIFDLEMKLKELTKFWFYVKYRG
jgi:hypothetical protein